MSKLNGSVLIRQVTFGALLKHGGHAFSPGYPGEGTERRPARRLL